MPTATMNDDPDVKIPAAVRAQAERAEALFNQQGGDRPNPPAEPEEQPQPSPQPTELDAPSLTQSPANPGPQPTEDEPSGDDEKWEEKYKAMHGRVKGLLKDNQRASERIANLENIIAAMQAAPDVAPVELAFEDVSDEERNDYGEDMLKVVGKKAMAQVAPILKQMQERLDAQAQTIKHLTGKQSVTDQDKTNAYLDKELPNWREINFDDEFVAWLSLPDPFSGGIRHDMLKEAYAAGNAPRVLAFFNGFLKEQGATGKTSSKEPDPAATRVAKVPLEELAAPGRAKAAPTAPQDPAKPIIARADIVAFYADVAAGKYRGRDAEKDAAEAVLFSAQREGRIR